jgi:hypothetical protein
MHFAIYSSAKDPNVTFDFLRKVAVAITVQLTQHFQAYFELGASSSVSVYADPSVIPEGARRFEITDEIPEAPDAVAYHSVDARGNPFCKIGWKVCLAMARGIVSEALRQLSIGISHECLEAEADPYVCEWSDMPDGVREVAVEVCDPVESDSYDIDVGGHKIAVSNFVTARWFDSGSPTDRSVKFDYLGKLKAPFTKSSGGYWVVREGGPTGTVTQEFGESVTDEKREQKTKFGRWRQRS